MATIQLYGLNRCSTCVKAMAWLSQHELTYVFTDYRDHPVAAPLLTRWSVELGGWEKLVNRASMTWRNLPDERKSPDSTQAWLTLIAEFPALVKRPVMIDPAGKVSVGFSDKKYNELLGGSHA